MVIPARSTDFLGMTHPEKIPLRVVDCYSSPSRLNMPLSVGEKATRIVRCSVRLCVSNVPIPIGQVMETYSDEFSSSEDELPREQTTARRVRVASENGEDFLLDRSFWRDSQVVRQWAQGNDSPLPLECSSDILRCLMRAQVKGILPVDVQSLWSLLSVSHKLRLGNLREQCLNRLVVQEDILDEIYSYSSSTMRAFVLKKMFDSPLRTAEINQAQVVRAADYGISVSEVKNLLKLKRRGYRHLELDLLPVPLGKRAVPIVIFNRTGVRQSGVCLGGVCIPLRLFGKFFDLDAVEIDSFYLRMAEFVLYKSGRCVYQKRLDQPGDADKILENCTHFISRRRNVFVVIEDGTKSRVFRSKRDNECQFDCIYSTSETISSIDFNCDAEQLLILKSESVSVFGFLREQLVLLQQFDGVFGSALFNQNHVVAFSYAGQEGKTLRASLKKLYQTQDFTLKSERGRLVNPSSLHKNLLSVQEGTRISPLAGLIFKVSRSGLRMYEDEDEYPICSAEEYVASSELCLLP